MFGRHHRKITVLIGMLLAVTLTGGEVLAVTVGLTTQPVQRARAIIQDSAVVLTSVGNFAGVATGTATSLTAANLATTDGGADGIIYAVPETDIGNDFYEFRIEAVTASTAFPAGKLNFRWDDGVTERLATLTLTAGDGSGDLDGATFRIQWSSSPDAGDTVRIHFEEDFTDGTTVTIKRKTLSFTT